MKKLAKSKLFWFAVAYACILAVALVFSLQVEHYECTLEDIAEDKKVNNIWHDIISQDLGLEDEITIVLYFEEKPTDYQVEQLEHLGIRIDRESWYPPTQPWESSLGHPWGSYFAHTKVIDICKLIDLEFVKLVEESR